MKQQMYLPWRDLGESYSFSLRFFCWAFGLFICRAMAITSSEALLLFEQEPLISSPAIEAIVYLPSEEIPGRSQCDLLSKILKAIGIGYGAYRYCYFSDEADFSKIVESEVLVVVFSPISKGIFKTVVEKVGLRNTVVAPSLQLIESDSDIKREVWNAIKPLAIR